MLRSHLVLVAPIALSVGASSVHAQVPVSYGIERLQSMTTYLEGTWAGVALNDNGLAVGTFTLAGVDRAWAMAAPAPVVMLPLPPGYTMSRALDVNLGGVVVGSVISGATTRGAVWTPSDAGYQVAVLGTLPGQFHSAATAINDRGDIIGASGPFTGVWFNAPEGIRNLAALGLGAIPVAINESRQICAENQRMNLDTGAIENLPDPPVNSIVTVSAVGINERGDIASNVRARVSSSSIWVWPARYTDAGGWQVIGPGIGSGYGPLVSKINDRGDILGHQQLIRGVYFMDAGFVSIESLLEPDAMYWVVSRSFSAGMNNHGQLLVYGEDGAVDTGWMFLATPTGTPVYPGDITLDAHVRIDDACAWESNPIDLDADGVVTDADRVFLFGRIAAWGTPVDDCNDNHVADACDIAWGAATDINLDTIPDSCQPDCNADALPDLADPDWNNNAVSDACEIASGAATDCNQNGVIDDFDRQSLVRTYTIAYPNPQVVIYPARTLEKSIFVRERGVIGDVNFRLHDWYRVGDISVRLVHDGVSVTLIDRPGYPNNFGLDTGFSELGYNITLDDEGTGANIENVGSLGGNFDPITSPPSYRPSNQLRAFDGLDMHGVWTLQVETAAALPPRSELISWGVVITKPAIKVDDCCPADVNSDGAVDSRDFFDFLAGFFAGAPESDFNHDGALDSRDFFAFVAAFLAGCE